MNTKKGISAVIATVLIILITVAAVTIIWAAVIPMINRQIGDSTACLEAIREVNVLNRGYTCVNYNGVTKNTSIQVSRGAGDYELADIQLSISAAGTSRSYRVLANNETTLSPSVKKDDIGKLPQANEEKVFIINTTGLTGTPDKVTVAAVVKTEGALKVCEASTTVVELTQCQ